MNVAFEKFVNWVFCLIFRMGQTTIKKRDESGSNDRTMSYVEILVHLHTVGLVEMNVILDFKAKLVVVLLGPGHLPTVFAVHKFHER